MKTERYGRRMRQTGNEFELSVCLSSDWLITLAASPSWKWPPLTGSSCTDKQEAQTTSACVCVCVRVPFACVYVCSSACLRFALLPMPKRGSRAPESRRGRLKSNTYLIKLFLNTVLLANASALTVTSCLFVWWGLRWEDERMWQKKKKRQKLQDMLRLTLVDSQKHVYTVNL